MNDPHVAALLYRVEHSPFVSYDKAEPFTDDLPEFRIRIEGRTATIEPKEHFATVEEARQVVEPSLRAWELDTALSHDANVLQFTYATAKMIDRKPTPGVAADVSAKGVGARVTVNVILPLERYATPPLSGLAVEPGSDVAAMFDTWRRYKAGQARLGDTADFCRGALEKGGGRQAAAQRYRIDRAVINELGDLADKKGGPDARKYKGYGRPYTQTERAWLEAILKKLIRRAAEVAYDPNADRALITMTDPDLPRL
jgi:hypothetical protein